jgi:hypothetical protein
MTNQSTAESAGILAAKAAPPVTVSIATIGGYQISELVLWATLIYTILMVIHKAIAIYRDLQSGGKK